MRHLRSREPNVEGGQILVLFAGSVLFLLLMVGLVVDAGFAFTGRRDAQNVSDLSALAGTRQVAEQYIGGSRSSGAVYGEIGVVADANGCTVASGCSWSASYVNSARTAFAPVTEGGLIPGGALGVEVDVNRPTPTLIVGPVMSMLNQNPISSWNVNTTATALAGSTRTYAGAGQLLPIALLEPRNPDTGERMWFQEGRVYQVTDAALDAPGSFGWLSWTGAVDAGTLMDSVCTPDSPGFTLPSWIENSPGAKNKGGVSDNGIKACLQDYLDNQTPILVPVYGTGCSGTTDVIRGNGSGTDYCIVGVVEMQLKEINWAPAVKSIKAYFKKVFAYGPGSIPPGVTIQPPSSSDKAYFLGLVK